MKNSIIFIILSFLLLLLTACGKDELTYKTINMDEAKQLIDKHPDYIVLDVRTPEEFAESHIPNAVLYPLQELESKIAELDKNKTYIVICRSGNRSITASEILIKNGFKNVYNTSGGMNEWKYEVIKQHREVN